MPPFVKGQPKLGGRTKGTPNKSTKALRDILLPLTPLATKQLKGLLKSEDEMVRMKAVQEVYDRTYGKATQAINHGGSIGVAHFNVEKLDDDQLESLLNLILAAEETADESADPSGAAEASELQEDGGDQT